MSQLCQALPIIYRTNLTNELRSNHRKQSPAKASFIPKAITYGGSIASNTSASFTSPSFFQTRPSRLSTHPSYSHSPQPLRHAPHPQTARDGLHGGRLRRGNQRVESTRDENPNDKNFDDSLSPGIPPANQTNPPNPNRKEGDKEPKKYIPKETSLFKRFRWLIPVVIAILAINIAIIVVVDFHQAGVLQSALEKFLQLEGQFKHALEKALQIPIVLQIASLSSLVWFVRYGLEPALRYLHRNVSRRSQSWEKTRLAWLFRDVYGPLEILLILTSFCRFLDGVVAPYLLHLPAGLVERFTIPLLQMALIVASTRVLMNWRSRLFAEWYFQLEMDAKKEPKKRIETLEKIINVVMIVIAAGLSLQAWGIDIQSLFAVGGLSGVALALAGRDVMQNLFAGGMILATDPFSEGEEISFYYSGSQYTYVAGFVMDIGWYRTTVKSYEREVFIVPNNIFSTTVVLNISRKKNEWRMLETIGLQLEDAKMVGEVIKEFRGLLKNDDRVMDKLPRRVFLNGISTDGRLELMIMCYIEAVNRDRFMGIREDLFQKFITIVQVKGGHLAMPVLRIENAPHRPGIHSAEQSKDTDNKMKYSAE